MRPSRVVVMLTAAILAVGCQTSGDGLEITQARIGAPTGPNAGMYFTVTNGSGAPDRLVGAATGVAGAVEIHETTLGEDGAMGMRPVTGIDVPADGEVVLEPGGMHLMLLDVDRLAEGDEVLVTLLWEVAGEMEVVAEVVAPAETMGDEHGH